MKLNRGSILLASLVIVLFLFTWIIFLPKTTVTDCLKQLQKSTLLSSSGNSCQVSLEPQNSKKFAYLIQTESCLNDYLSSREVLGDAGSCQCNVLVLSFKRECNNTSLPHVQYLFDPSTTWTTGRNLLFKTIMAQKLNYVYYTFLDDDVVLRYGDLREQGANPWRDYEISVLEVQPLLAVSWHLTESIFHRYYWGFCNYPNNTKFLPHVWFDALFNSFHRNVICHLLPYYEAMDHVSWWFSQVYLVIKTDLMFPGQALLHLDVFADNPVHRSYPRSLYSTDVIKQFAENLMQQVPQEYRELLKPKLQDWVDDYHSKEYVFPNYCVDLPIITDNVIPYGNHICKA